MIAMLKKLLGLSELLYDEDKNDILKSYSWYILKVGINKNEMAHHPLEVSDQCILTWHILLNKYISKNLSSAINEIQQSILHHQLVWIWGL